MSNILQKRVLVTALGTMNCTTIVRELRKMPENFYIIGADINPVYTIYTSSEVDEYHQFPKATVDRQEYFQFVKQFCIEHHIDVYYCVVDEEVETMAMHREELSLIGVALCLANTEAIVTCHNKDKFAVWSEHYIPEYCIKRYPRYEDVNDESFPLFVKPKEGRASIGCVKVSNREELRKYQNNWSDYIVQEYTTGTFIAADVVRCRKTGITQICQRQELLRNGNGCGVSVKIVSNNHVERACTKIAELLDLDGVVNTEFFVDEKGVKIIEVNPRIPAGVEYSCLAGLNLVRLAYEIAIGKEIVSYGSIRNNTYFAKRYETYELKPKLITENSVRLTVFSEIFLKKSLVWLNDTEIREGMDIQYVTTPAMQVERFSKLPYRQDYKASYPHCSCNRYHQPQNEVPFFLQSE